jgi:hypothetical protein
MAAGLPSHTGGRRNALESLGDFRPELTVTAQDVWILQVDVQDTAPRRASSVGLVPDYRVNAPRAVCKAASAHACLDGTPQRRAAAKPLASQATVSRCARRPYGC